MIRFLVLVFALSCTVYAQDNQFTLLNIDPPKPNVNVQTSQKLQRPYDAVSMALQDLQAINEPERQFIRYIWIQEPSMEKIAAVSFTINTTINRTSVIVNPDILYDGSLLRFDFRKYVYNEQDLLKLIKAYEPIGNDPYFHLVQSSYVVPDSAKRLGTLAGDPLGSIRFTHNGKGFFLDKQKLFILQPDHSWLATDVQEFKTNVTVYGAHVGLEQSTLLLGLANNTSVVTRYDYFITKALTTLEGGLYYKLSGIEANPVGKTAQEALLESLGSSEKRVEALNTSQRVAMFKSRVTGRPRRLDLFQGEGVAVSNGTGLISITRDGKEGDVQAIQDPIRSLLDFEDSARELIAEKPNGLHLFALFDNQGRLQDQAPDFIVKDHTIPPPHTARLQSAISCIRCHGPLDGWQPFENEVQTMLSGLFDIYDDASSKDNIPATLTKLASLYSGDLSKVIRRARDDYNDAAIRSTYGNYNISQISEIISNIYSDYNYVEVDAAIALKDLGVRVNQDDAQKFFTELVVPRHIYVNGVIPEDPIIAALKSGLKVNRFQWELVYADAAIRSMEYIGGLK